MSSFKNWTYYHSLIFNLWMVAWKPLNFSAKHFYCSAGILVYVGQFIPYYVKGFKALIYSSYAFYIELL